MSPNLLYEKQHQGPVCGVDEVGRGPLAGPVIAAAVILRPDAPADLLSRLDDSKKLTALRRADLAERLRDHAYVSIAACDVEEIDRINILQATMLAMKKAVEGLDLLPRAALIDGNRAPDLSCTVQTIVKGDSKSLSIAAASIVAKHHRDELMKSWSIKFPEYQWEKNAGYGTAAHLKAIQIHGVTPLHRRSFAPVADYLLKESNSNN